MAIMMKGAGLNKDEERRGRLASKFMDGDKLLFVSSHHCSFSLIIRALASRFLNLRPPGYVFANNCFA